MTEEQKKQLIDGELSLKETAMGNKKENEVKSKKHVGKCYHHNMHGRYYYFISINDYGLLDYISIEISDDHSSMYQGCQALSPWTMDNFEEIPKDIFKAVLIVLNERITELSGMNKL